MVNMVASGHDAMSQANGVIERALVVIEALAGCATPVPMSELARIVGYPKSTTHRMLRSLTERGFAARVGHRYSLGPRLLRLTRHTAEPNNRMRRVMPFLVELHNRTAAAASLAVLSQGQFVVYSEVLYDRGGPLPALRRAAGLPAHATAAGKVLLAYAPAALGGYDRQALPSLTPHTLTEFNRLHSELGAVRRRGVAFAREEYALQEIEVAVPVFSPNGSVFAALSVAGHADLLDLPAAAELARSVGHAATMHLRRPAAHA